MQEAEKAKSALNGKIERKRPMRVNFVTERVNFKRRREETVDTSREYLTKEEEAERRKLLREREEAEAKKLPESVDSMRKRAVAVKEKIEGMKAAKRKREEGSKGGG